MIIGLGVDIAEVDRIEAAIQRRGEAFLKRVFTPDEIAYCEKHKQKFERYAARFAAKEATMKALSTGWRNGVRWVDLEVAREPSGKPTMHLHGRARELADQLGVRHISLSLTHSGNTAFAQVIFENEVNKVNLVERIFLSEVGRQCSFALRAMGQLKQALASNDVSGVFFYAQAFLGSAGNISKLLWPNTKYEARGKALRDQLLVPADCVVHPRKFRNHFEHFDERLEKWATSSKRKNFVDSNVFPPSAIAGIDPEDFLRNLDPTNLTLSFCGDTYDLRKVESAILGIASKAKEFLVASNGCSSA